MKFSSKDASIVPVMAVVSAVCHIAVGPIVSRSVHLPGPTLAGPLIIAPIMVAGAITLRRGILLLTSVLNGFVLSIFVPIGFLAIPIYAVVGATLEAFYVKSFKGLFQPSYSFLAGGIGNAFSVLLIAAIALGMRSIVVLFSVSAVGFIAGGIGGLIAASIMSRLSTAYPSKLQIVT